MNPELIQLALGGLALLGCIGLVFGLGLAMAAHKFAVEVNPKIEEVLETLPMAQCGGCGFPGCEGYAIAVVEDPNVSPTLCFPGKAEVAAQIAALTGKEAAAFEDSIATVRCSCLDGNVKNKLDYIGFASCTAANLAFGGPSSCAYACIGLADCQVSCPFNAIKMVDNFPIISPALCVSCGICVDACPKNIIEIMPLNARVHIPCMTQDPGKTVKKVCDIGCVYCKVCIKKCPAQAMTYEDGVIKIDHKSCLEYGTDCNEICISCCPRDIVLPYSSLIKEAQKLVKAA